MKPYGVDRKDRGCCPGHDKFPPDHYNSRVSEHAHSRDSRLAHKRARARAKASLKNIETTGRND